MKAKHTCLIALGLAASTMLAQAQPPAPMSSLEPTTIDDVTYLCGGVGIDEANYMKSEARNYDLMLTFAARDGSYLADVNVDIADARGNSVLQTTCDAPIMLVDLPKGGTYRIHSEVGGHKQTNTAQVAKKGRATALIVVWPNMVVDSVQ
jgi:hypothetical protein